ncbi:MAG: hypothetical protein KDC36_02575 [Thermoleophilia bacterium]|nr:hypothetical protein [Thermoleophilia bacterium]
MPAASQTPAPPSTEQLEHRVAAFARRLYRSTLVARAVFPLTALAAVLLAPPQDDGNSVLTRAAWLVLVLWTLGTLPLAWSRLDWVTRVPWIVRIEVMVFLALIVLGWGSRSWHLLHAFVPLSFAAFFLRPRAGRLMAGAMIVAVWLPHLITRLWADAPIQAPIAAITPTALTLTGWALVTYVRRLVGDVHALIDAQRQAGASLLQTRERLAARREVRDVHRRVGERLQTFSGGLTLDGVPAEQRPEQLEGVLVTIKRGIEALTAPDAPEARRPLVDLLDTALAETAVHGPPASLQVDPDSAGVVPRDASAMTRLLTETLTNAHRHGDGAPRIEVTRVSDTVHIVAVHNQASSAPEPRLGHFGLHDMAADAAAAGASVQHRFVNGTVTTTIRLVVEAEGADAGADPAGLLATIRSRRLDYERGVLVVRLGFALLTCVMLFVKADAHRTLLPVMVATAIALIAWNAGLLLWWRRLSAHAARHTGWAWVDAGTMVAFLTFEGGMSTPWIPLSMGAILAVVHYRSWREGVALVSLLSGGLLVGYALMRTLPVDDQGTLVQDLPFGWVFNVAAYGVVLAIACGMRWVFDRVDEASAAYTRTVDAEMAAMRDAATQQAEEAARRDYHAHLTQHVSAARLWMGVVDENGPLKPIDESLLAIRGVLTTVMADLEAGRFSAPDR